MAVATMAPKAVAERQRILLLTMSMSVTGGAEAQVAELAAGFDRREWDVQVVVLLPPVGPAADFTGTGVKVTCLDMRRGVPNPTALFRFIAKVRAFRPHVVHSHVEHANLLARVARPFCPMPVLVCTLHGFKMYSVYSGNYLFKELAHRATDRLADITTVVCEAAAQRYAENKAVSRERLMMVPNGIRTGAFCPNEATRAGMRAELRVSDEFLWLAAARMEQVKDYPTLLRAFAVALQADPNQVLAIAGDGSQRAQLERLAAELGITPKLRLLGVRRDVPELLSAADGFVMSSIFEALPLALLEAGGCGVPIVATRVGGNPEAMVEGRTGFLAAAQNPQDLGYAMQRLALLPAADRQAMGRAGREFVLGKYKLETILDRWEEIYSRLMARKGVGPRVKV